MKVVLDTNVLVSALFWQGPSKHVLLLARDRKITLCVNQELIEEFERVLGYAKFRHHLAALQIKMSYAGSSGSSYANSQAATFVGARTFGYAVKPRLAGPRCKHRKANYDPVVGFLGASDQNGNVLTDTGGPILRTSPRGWYHWEQ